MNPHLFREYDIRGHADRDLPSEIVTQLGQALGTWFVRRQHTHLAVGRDGRTHSPRLHQALLQGLVLSGIHIFDVGMVATPLLYYATFQLQTGAGIQITASHNPKEDNGFKIIHQGEGLHGKAISDLYHAVLQKDFLEAAVPGGVQATSIEQDYKKFVLSHLQLGPRRFKIVVDAGNGMGGVVLVPLLQELGFDVIPMYCEIDGRFPNHPADPAVPSNLQGLQRAVLTHQAHLGIALDGDADRLGAVDEMGHVVAADQVLIVLGQAVLQQRKEATFLADVKCSQAVFDVLRAAGGHVVMSRTGHSVMQSAMKRTGALLGGELSGHLFFADRYLGYDDAIYAALRLVEVLSQSSQSLSERLAAFPGWFHTPELRKKVPNLEQALQQVKNWARTLPEVTLIEMDGIRIAWSDAWALVRLSNTESVLSLRFEAKTQARLHQVQNWVEAQLEVGII